MTEDLYDTRIDAYTLRQTRGTKGTPAPIFTPPPVVPELTEAQKARLARQQQFRDAYSRLEALAEDMRVFSCEHHYFKPSTKQSWLWSLENALEGMRAFLPKESASPETNGAETKV
jgi:hypothetical protein